VAVNNQDRFIRNTALEKYVDKLIEAKNIDTFQGSVAVIMDTQKKAPKTLGGSDFKFGDIKPVKGYQACLLPDFRYAIVLYQGAWDMMGEPNKKLGLLYLLNQVESHEKTGEPTLSKPDVRGYRRFLKKYGFDWVYDQNVQDPLAEETATAGVSE
jgi:hypothetical protein